MKNSLKTHNSLCRRLTSVLAVVCLAVSLGACVPLVPLMVGGAVVGGLLGGKKGALIGGLAGAGTGALVTHKQKPKNYTRRWYPRRTTRNY